MSLSARGSLDSNENGNVCVRIAAGSPAAEASLHQQYWRGLVMMLERRCQNSHLAEDLAQDTLFIVINKVRNGAVTDPAKLTGFIHSTAKNCFSNWQRKEWRRATVADTEQVESATANRLDPVRQLVRQESRTLVRRLVNSLKKERDRDVLHRLYVLDQEKTQICAALEMGPADFDRIISRARARMRQLITHRMGADNLTTNWEEWTT